MKMLNISLSPWVADFLNLCICYDACNVQHIVCVTLSGYSRLAQLLRSAKAPAELAHKPKVCLVYK